MGLVNRLSKPGAALADAIALAERLAQYPQRCLRSDRRSAIAQWGMPEAGALLQETRLGRKVLDSGESRAGAIRFRKNGPFAGE
ncbi:MAG: hypothetical protein RQ826_04740 [Xanthomonadales bacterium]|nr:hypothetical protein [Xanthomonadales bacterium]